MKSVRADNISTKLPLACKGGECCPIRYCIFRLKDVWPTVYGWDNKFDIDISPAVCQTSPLSECVLYESEGAYMASQYFKTPVAFLKLELTADAVLITASSDALPAVEHLMNLPVWRNRCPTPSPISLDAPAPESLTSVESTSER